MTTLPTKIVGPLHILMPEGDLEVVVPLATYETPLWYSTQRGMRVAKKCGGVHTTVLSDQMTRSIVLEGPHTFYLSKIKLNLTDLQNIVQRTSRFAKLIEWNTQIVGNLFYIRFSFETGEASGHNMATKAAEALLNFLLFQYSELRYVSISGNYCTDKKVSAVNGILGRGKYVVAELSIPRDICLEMLRTLPEKIVDLNIKKNLIGSILAGSVRSANAHFANMLLALFLPTGQDAANIIEGSQGITHAEMREDNLYFSVTLPNLIIGTRGNGKNFSFVQENLKLLQCDKEGVENAKRLAMIMAGTVLCGELSLLAAQTNPGELVKTHMKLERKEIS
jgi:hydroxymethylglutaryl-CoA reductase (NADPH)